MIMLHNKQPPPNLSDLPQHFLRIAVWVIWESASFGYRSGSGFLSRFPYSSWTSSYPGHFLLMADDASEKKPNSTIASKALVCIISANILLVKANYIVNAQDDRGEMLCSSHRRETMAKARKGERIGGK